jgi:cbb3-type cytochrome oxidase subunit 3
VSFLYFFISLFGFWYQKKTKKSRDYATWLNEQDGVISTDPQYDYKMVYILAI